MYVSMKGVKSEPFLFCN